jgi:DNA adenine methylase
MNYFLVKAKNAVFKVADFREIMQSATEGDVVYCDPPYVPLSTTANFTTYSSGGFALKDQVDLAELAGSWGVPVLIANDATEFTLNAYKTAIIKRFYVRRYISCNGSNRDKA